MKEIHEMSIDEMHKELIAFCNARIECKHCELSLFNHLGKGDIGHDAFADITDRNFLALMVAIARGYLVWKHAENDPNDPEGEHSNVPDQPKIPPMPEPVELPEAKVSELSVDVSVNVPEDMTVIMISGKKPTSMTVFYDQEGGGADGT